MCNHPRDAGYHRPAASPGPRCISACSDYHAMLSLERDQVLPIQVLWLYWLSLFEGHMNRSLYDRDMYLLVGSPTQALPTTKVDHQSGVLTCPVRRVITLIPVLYPPTHASSTH